MKKRGIIFYIILSVTILSVVSIIYSLIFLNESENDKRISFAVGLIRLIFSISTFILAILLYDRFGFRKKMYEKKLELVLDVLIKLKQLRIVIIAVNKKTHHLASLDIQKNMHNQHLLNEINLFSNVLFDPVNIYGNKDLMEIKSLKSNPILPKGISESLEFLFPKILRGGKSLGDEYSEKFVQIDFGNESKLKIINTEGWVFPDEGMTFETFISHFENSLKTIEDWLDSHSSIKSELNI